MAGRYLDIDEFAGCAVAASQCKEYAPAPYCRSTRSRWRRLTTRNNLALRELRTHRHIASIDHLALLVDCERALGRLPKAMEVIAENSEGELPTLRGRARHR